MAEEGIAAGAVMGVNSALHEVLKTALIHHGLTRGIRQAVEALDKCQAHLCVLDAALVSLCMSSSRRPFVLNTKSALLRLMTTRN